MMCFGEIGEITANIKLYDGRTIEIQGKLLELSYNIGGYDPIALELMAKDFKEMKSDDWLFNTSNDNVMGLFLVCLFYVFNGIVSTIDWWKGDRMTDKELVIIDPIESLIESQNNELKKTIRECRNNLTRLMTEMNNSLTMSDLLLIQKEKSFLDAMDYAIDNKENMKWPNT